MKHYRSDQEDGNPTEDDSTEADSRYVPLEQRLNQDVWHDNFVPKYSALANARPSRLVLIGVWLLFGPALLMSVVMGVAALLSPKDSIADWFGPVFAVLAAVLLASILIVQTKRYRNRKPPSASERAS